MIIRFEMFQYLTFVISTSLFLYMTIAFIKWFINECKPKKPGPLARFGRKE
jgi:hypothetical protein